jgi:NADH-quinone oxidoreductase subunit M
MDAQYSHAHDAVTIVDRLPLLLMIGCSIVFGIFPGHFYDVIRSSVDPLLARIAVVEPLANQDREGLGVRREATAHAIAPRALRLPDDASRGEE